MRNCTSTSLIRHTIPLVLQTRKRKNGQLRLSSSAGMFKESIQIQKTALMLMELPFANKLACLLQEMTGDCSTFSITLLSTILTSRVLILDIVSMLRVLFSLKREISSLPSEDRTRHLSNGKRSEYATTCDI